jgi:hypothetical protein
LSIYCAYDWLVWLGGWWLAIGVVLSVGSEGLYYRAVALAPGRSLSWWLVAWANVVSSIVLLLVSVVIGVVGQTSEPSPRDPNSRHEQLGWAVMGVSVAAFLMSFVIPIAALARSRRNEEVAPITKPEESGTH